MAKIPIQNIPKVWTLPQCYDSLNQHERRAVREEYRRQQNDNCLHCGSDLDNPPPTDFLVQFPITQELFPPDMFKYPVHLHHNHWTGLTIGAVHCQCNAILWQYHGE